MLEFETALERILRAVPSPGGEIIPTGEANHRIVAETIRGRHFINRTRLSGVSSVATPGTTDDAHRYAGSLQRH